MNLSPEEKQIGKDNFQEAVGTTRRDFLKGSIAATVAAGGIGALGGYYFKYDKVANPLRVAILGTGDEGGVLIGALNPDYIDVRAIADIRPYSIHRAFHGDSNARAARPGLLKVYDWKTEDEAREHVKVFEGESGGYKTLLEDPDLDIEAVIVALPLHLHDVAAIYAMRKGKHVLTEKLMGHSVARSKEMSRVAESTGKILAVGHQRHYSILYDNAVSQIKQGLIGDIHHIRAQWHRNNLPGNDSWQPPLPEISDYTEEQFLADLKAVGADTRKQQALRQAHPLFAQLTKLRGDLKAAVGAKIDELADKVAQAEAQLRDKLVQAENYGYVPKTLEGGYQRSALEELIRWRLWERTGGGLMAELGSHQLDAASIFITAQRPDGKKVKPLTVSAVGGRSIFPADRECDDHVYCTFEFPGTGYYKGLDTTEVADPNKKVVVTYSSINGNGFGGYGEVVFGTKGTLILEQEQEAMLFKGSATTTKIEVKAGAGGKPAMDTYETGGGAALAQVAAGGGSVSRGYREEMEHWAWCIRNPDPANHPHCTPEVALGDAVIALTSNIAAAKRERIEFNPAWFDIHSDETPEGVKPRQANEIA